jgi:hypothetical protein
MMQHFIKKAVVAMLLTVVVFSCKKKDDDQSVNTATETVKTDFKAPVITLKGDDYLTISRNSTFEDPGATAIDNVDGDISNRIQVSGLVDSSQFGIYNLVYTVTDVAGNAATPVVRNVEVVFGRDDYLGSYEVDLDDNCSATFQLNTSQDVTAGSTANQIIFNNFMPLLGGSVPATVNGFQVTMEPTNLQTFFNVSGSGTMDSEGKVLVMTITIENTIPFVGGTETCTATYTKN